MHSNIFQSKWKVEVTLVARMLWFQGEWVRGTLELLVFSSCSVPCRTCTNPSKPQLLTWTLVHGGDP